MSDIQNPGWWLYQGTGDIDPRAESLDFPEPPPWRDFSRLSERGRHFKPDPTEVELVNAAIYLRRPLLIEGKPGTGKTTLAYAVARELKLSSVLRWPITTRSQLQDGLYRYDAVARLQDTSLYVSRLEAALKTGQAAPAEPDIADYLRLGPLGTALAHEGSRPRVLLIDEIDKSDLDFANDLLHVLEEGWFEIPELTRLAKKDPQHPFAIATEDRAAPVVIPGGCLQCGTFPLIFMTSNGERDFPPAFLRRCLRLHTTLPDEKRLLAIAATHLEALQTQPELLAQLEQTLIPAFRKKRDDDNHDLATDQLLNAVYLALKDIPVAAPERKALLEALWQSLSET